MAATALNFGVIVVNTEDTGNPLRDLKSLILLAPIGSGIGVHLTGRNWNGLSFATTAEDGTLTFTRRADLPAGTVIQISRAQLITAGINLSDADDPIYAYQGTTTDAPTLFLQTVDITDETLGFDGMELLNTGLANGTSAVAFGTSTTGMADIDNAESAAPTPERRHAVHPMRI